MIFNYIRIWLVGLVFTIVVSLMGSLTLFIAYNAYLLIVNNPGNYAAYLGAACTMAVFVKIIMHVGFTALYLFGAVEEDEE